MLLTYLFRLSIFSKKLEISPFTNFVFQFVYIKNLFKQVTKVFFFSWNSRTQVHVLTRNLLEFTLFRENCFLNLRKINLMKSLDSLTCYVFIVSYLFCFDLLVSQIASVSQIKLNICKSSRIFSMNISKKLA